MSPEAAAGAKKKLSTQYAALPWRQAGERGVEVLVITSRETRRWVIPKGWPIKGLKPWEAAATEAFEEAGVRGEAEHAQFGAFRYDKVRKSGRLRPVKVRVFRLRVTEVLDDWPERAMRQRQWVAPAEAAERVAEPELKELLIRMGGVVRIWPPPAAGRFPPPPAEAD